MVRLDAHMRTERNVEISNAAGGQRDRSGSASCGGTAKYDVGQTRSCSGDAEEPQRNIDISCVRDRFAGKG